jgi:hypothetical protein
MILRMSKFHTILPIQSESVDEPLCIFYFSMVFGIISQFG